VSSQRPQESMSSLYNAKPKKYLSPKKMFSPFLFPLFPPNGEEPSPATGLATYWNVPKIGTFQNLEHAHASNVTLEQFGTRAPLSRSSRLRDHQNLRCPPAGKAQLTFSVSPRTGNASLVPTAVKVRRGAFWVTWVADNLLTAM
jgi:hypothetical protein